MTNTSHVGFGYVERDEFGFRRWAMPLLIWVKVPLVIRSIVRV